MMNDPAAIADIPSPTIAGVFGITLKTAMSESKFASIDWMVTPAAIEITLRGL